MKKIKIVFPLVLAVLTVREAAAQKGYVIKGDIKGWHEPYAYLNYTDGGVLHRDSVKIVNERFIFKGKVEHTSPAYLIALGKGVVKNRFFYLENSNIVISGSLDSLDYAKVSGSETFDDYRILQRSHNKTARQKDTIYKAYKKAETESDSVTLKVYDNRLYVLDSLDAGKSVQYIQRHPDNILSLSEMERIVFLRDGNTLNGLYGNLSPWLKNSDRGKKLGEFITSLISTKVGQQAPEFTQKDTTGNTVSLSDFRGKYVLIDFWASWCGPCRAENPNVVKAFNQFKDRNFTVLGVSLDRDKYNWTKAIKDDKLPWTQVSDLKYWENDVALTYGIESVPANFLIDPTGKIIARNLRGDELENELAKVLK